MEQKCSKTLHIACISGNNGITAHATGVLLSSLAALRRFFWLFCSARENPTPAGTVMFIKQQNTCLYMLKLDYTSALFFFCIFHIHLFPFPNHLFLWLLPTLAWLQLVLLSPLSRDRGEGGKDGAGCERGEVGHVWKPTSDV